MFVIDGVVDAGGDGSWMFVIDGVVDAGGDGSWMFVIDGVVDAGGEGSWMFVADGVVDAGGKEGEGVETGVAVTNRDLHHYILPHKLKALCN